MTTLAAAVASRLPEGLVASAAVALYPRFEPELRRLADFCPADGVALDIGGWYGPWSRRLAARCTEVVTVEPVPHLAERLRRTLPSNARVVQGAATDREGTARLWFPEGDRGDRGCPRSPAVTSTRTAWRCRRSPSTVSGCAGSAS